MRSRSFLLPFAAALAAPMLGGYSACVVEDAATTSTTGGLGGAGGAASGAGGVGGSGGDFAVGGSGAGGGPSVRCTLDNGNDPAGLCTQKLVLKTEVMVAYDAKRGLAESWDSTTASLDVDAMNAVLHDPRDDAAFGAAVARYTQEAMHYGDTEITDELLGDLVTLEPTLVSEFTTPPAGYAGELYLDLRNCSAALHFGLRDDLAAEIDPLADAYGGAIYANYFVTLAGGDAGATDAVLGSPAGGGATAYAPADVATGALALADMAVRFATIQPANAALWQQAAATVLAHLDARARDPSTGLFYASLITSADPGHDTLAPAPPAGPPADALVTEIQARVALALLRIQDLVSASGASLPALAAVPLSARASAIIEALDATPTSLWDSAGALPNGDGGTIGSGYFAGWVPSTAELLTDKGIRANALLMAAIEKAPLSPSGPDAPRASALRKLIIDRLGAPVPAEVCSPDQSFMSVVDNQNGYFLIAPTGFDFAAVDAGLAPREKSYFSSANAAAVEGLFEVFVAVSN